MAEAAITGARKDLEEAIGAALEAGADPAEIFGWVRSELLRVGTDPDQFDSEPPRQEESLL
jgi:hypothetical protein